MTQRDYERHTSELSFPPSWDDLHDLERQLLHARHAIRVWIALAFMMGILLGLWFGGWVLPWVVGK